MNLIYNEDITNFDIRKNTIFLAGPTSRINCHESWRKNAIKYLEEFGFDGNIIIPEPKNCIVSNNIDKNNQIKWERHYLSISNLILFWIPRNNSELIGLTTNIELGEWYKSNKIVIGFPENSIKNDYIKYIIDENNLDFYNDLEELCKISVEKLNRNPNVWFTSDTHYNQDRAYLLTKRPFLSLKQMNQMMISNHNSKVYVQDKMYHLGDFGDAKYFQYLSGNDYKLLLGNYDNESFMIDMENIDKNYRITFLTNNSEFNDKINLIHEPEFGINENKFHLFGHIHKHFVKTNGLNVGVDCHHFFPIDLETVYFYKNAVENFYDKNVFLSTIGIEK